jgi:hypothetical protein
VIADYGEVRLLYPSPMRVLIVVSYTSFLSDAPIRDVMKTAIQPKLNLKTTLDVQFAVETSGGLGREARDYVKMLAKLSGG